MVRSLHGVRGVVIMIGAACSLTFVTAVGHPSSALSIDSSHNGSRTQAKRVRFQLAKPDKPLILVKTMVDDQGPFEFILDTGAGITMISTELAKKLNIASDGSEKGYGAGGSVDVHYGKLKSIAIDATRLEELKVGIMDLKGISNAIETNVDGIIGYNFLSRFRVTIDYPKSSITFE